MNKRLNQFFGLASTIAILCSCGHSLSPEAYIKWVENPKNGLSKSRNFGPVEYTVQYKTPEYIMLKNNKYEKVDKEGHNGIHYFGLNMNPYDKKTQLLYINMVSEQDYFARIQYFSFDFKRDIYLNVSGEQFPCEYYFLENTGNISPGLTFTLGFDTKEEKGDLQLVVNDRVFGNGGMNFLIKEKTLNNIPQLKTHS